MTIKIGTSKWLKLKTDWHSNPNSIEIDKTCYEINKTSLLYETYLVLLYTRISFSFRRSWSAFMAGLKLQMIQKKSEQNQKAKHKQLKKRWAFWF